MQRKCQMISWTQWVGSLRRDLGLLWALTIYISIKAMGSLRHRSLSERKRWIRTLPWETPPFYGQVVKKKRGREKGREGGRRERGERERFPRKEGKLGDCYAQKPRKERDWWKSVWGGVRSERKVNKWPNKNRCLSKKLGLWRGEERQDRVQTNVRGQIKFLIN